MTPSPKTAKELAEEVAEEVLDEHRKMSPDRTDYSWLRQVNLSRALLDSLQREERATAEAERDMKNMAKDHLDSEVGYRTQIRDLEQRLAAAEAKAGAHNTGLERAAEIVQSVGQDWLNNADYPLGLGKASRGHAACSNAAQAIRREIK